jgi:hypothetical protein
MFSADHAVPRAADPARVTDYENLLYACVRCNSRKQDVLGLPNPCQVAFGDLLQVASDGRVTSESVAGRQLIDVLQLNDERLTRFRAGMLEMVQLAAAHSDLLGMIIGFPDDLPDLSRLRPPGGNTRPSGVQASCHAMRRRGQLPAGY